MRVSYVQNLLKMINEQIDSSKLQHEDLDSLKDQHRVHFEESSDTFGKDNKILVQRIGEDKVAVHLGFLQINHRYSISFSIPRSLCETSKTSQASFVESAIPNVNLNIVSITSKNSESIDFELTLLAYKEKLLKEIFLFQLSDKSSPINVTLNCRVLGKGKGTPLLKNDVHCIEVLPDEENQESDASDWQGFEKN